MRRIVIVLLVLLLPCAPAAVRAEEAPAKPIPLELTVRPAAAETGYGTALRLSVRIHNPSKTRTATRRSSNVTKRPGAAVRSVASRVSSRRSSRRAGSVAKGESTSTRGVTAPAPSARATRAR